MNASKCGPRLKTSFIWTKVHQSSLQYLSSFSVGLKVFVNVVNQGEKFKGWNAAFKDQGRILASGAQETQTGPSPHRPGKAQSAVTQKPTGSEPSCLYCPCFGRTGPVLLPQWGVCSSFLTVHCRYHIEIPYSPSPTLSLPSVSSKRQKAAVGLEV